MCVWYVCCVSVYVWVRAGTWHSICGGQRITFKSQSSPSTSFWRSLLSLCFPRLASPRASGPFSASHLTVRTPSPRCCHIWIWYGLQGSEFWLSGLSASSTEPFPWLSYIDFSLLVVFPMGLIYKVYIEYFMCEKISFHSYFSLCFAHRQLITVS